MTQADGAGWYRDPAGAQRYWDGAAWTEWVHDKGEVVARPVVQAPPPAPAPPAQTVSPVAARASPVPRPVASGTVPATADAGVSRAQIRTAFGGLLISVGVLTPGFTDPLSFYNRFNSLSWRTTRAGSFPLWAIALALAVGIVVVAYGRRLALARLFALAVLGALVLDLYLYHRVAGVWASVGDVVVGDFRVTVGVYLVFAGALLALLPGRATRG